MNNEDLRLLTIKNADGEEVELYIQKPRYDDIHGAQIEKALTFQRGIEKKLYLKKQMDKILRERGVWDDDLQDKLDTLTKELREKIERLEAGGMKLSEAKELALDISKCRNNLIILSTERQNFASVTADGLAEQAELDYLAAACTVYNSDRSKKYFKDYQDYLARKNDDDAYIISQRFAEILYDAIFDEKRLPENEFLIEYKFVDEDLRFINSEGHLVDIEGNLMNEAGQKVQYVDGEQVVIEENKRQPFLDDDGNPMTD